MRVSLTALASVLLLVASLALGGCGLKGDLYLPEDEPAAASGEDRDEADTGEGRSRPAA
jgi:predicted small lipoprotein YifL